MGPVLAFLKAKRCLLGASLLAPLNALLYLSGVESKQFVEHVKSILGGLAKGRKPRGEKAIILESLQCHMESMLGPKTKI